MAPLPRWAGIDVGARKGFDPAVIDAKRLVAGPKNFTEIEDLIGWLRTKRPRIVAVDSPWSWAPEGELSRQGERELVRAKVCHVRYTPHHAALTEKRTTYYAWIWNGFDLYAALLAANASEGWLPIECFPTATWSRLGQPRGKRTRARWSSEVLAGYGLMDLPTRMNQDARDAIGAAITARLYDERKTEPFGDIVVPQGQL